jgi:ABC-type Fe3+/spermidine/putrescine transport system ATPase subunit
MSALSPGNDEAYDVELRAVTKRFGSLKAVDAVSLKVRKGEFLSLLGPSGCGKTTSLRLVAGFEQPDEGEILIGGTDAVGTPPYRRDVNTVFQQYALFPHMSVLDNVAYGLKQRRVGKPERHARAREALELVRMTGRETHRPTTLSGGQQQRIALARALVMRPRVLLLDEPLGSLDRRLHDRLLDDLARLFEELGMTAVYVTHDQAEAFALGDRVAVMRDGTIAQTATPDELWARPADEDVARFLGLANVVETPSGRKIVRPEAVAVRVVRDGQPGDGVVESAVREGATVRLRLRLEDGGRLDAVVAALDHPQRGDRVAVVLDPAGMIDLP